MSTKIGSAVVGHGGMGHFHSTRMAENPELDFIGAYDILPERLADLPNNGKAYGSLEELLADDRIQLVTVATPNDVHKDIVIQALEAGKNVISEKPVTMTLADLDAMIAAADKAGRVFTVHQNRRWDRDFRIVKAAKEQGLLGQVYMVESKVQDDLQMIRINGAIVGSLVGMGLYLLVSLAERMWG